MVRADEDPDPHGPADPELVRELDLLLEHRGVAVEKEEPPGGRVVSYEVQARADAQLDLSLELTAAQLNVDFNPCYLMLELAAHQPKIGRNENALEAWRTKCLRVIGGFVSGDLMIETRWFGRWLLGGLLSYRDGDE